jgi:hypothetical protein
LGLDKRRELSRQGVHPLSQGVHPLGQGVHPLSQGLESTFGGRLGLSEFLNP